MQKRVKLLSKAQVPFRAQGTIEYLVIIGVVVVLSLVVVGLVTTQVGTSGDVADTSSEIKNKVGIGGISIIDSVAGLDENGLIVLKNTSSETLTINKINVNGVDHNFTNGQIVYGGDKKFRLSDIVSCDGTKKSYSIKIYFTSAYGLSKVADFQTITIDCTNSVPDTNDDEDQVLSFQCNDDETFYNGVGTLASPYGICNWLQLGNVSNYLDANFILLENIDSSSAGYDGVGAGWTPISGQFLGNFDGNGYTISDLFINLPSTANIGLFSSSSGTFSNLGLVDVNITGSNYVGGLVGISYGSISDSFSTGSVTGVTKVGGLVGFLDGSISDSFSTSSVTGSSYYAGGLVGQQYSGTIINSYALGNVNSSSDYVGGLVGYSIGSISNSFSTGTVNGAFGVGGLVGEANDLISSSFSTGSVTGSSRVGGLVGNLNLGSIVNGYWFDNVGDDATNCYSLSGDNVGDTNCTKKSAGVGGLSWFYDVNKLPMSGWSYSVWGTSKDDLNYPILKWQE